MFGSPVSTENNMVRKSILNLVILIGFVLSTSCSVANKSPLPKANMPNPASVFCEENGGILKIVTASDGSQGGVCTFSDGSTCDEWAYFRGECKPGGSSIQPAPSNTMVPPAELINEQIVFYSNRGDGYNNIYILGDRTLEVIRLTQGQNNLFSGPFSPDGKQILFTGFGLTHSYVGLMNSDGSNLVDITNQPGSDEAFPAWSPDGKQITFTSRRDGNNEIYVMNADGSNPRRITSDSKDDFAPTWSPDGQQIAFVSDRDNETGVYSIYIMKSDGSSVERLTRDGGNDYTPAWSPDGSQIAFRSVKNGQSDIYLVNLDGSNVINLTGNSAEDWAPAWSPDGSMIAYQTNRDGNWEIYMMNADGSDPINLTNHPADDQLPYWKP